MRPANAPAAASTSCMSRQAPGRRRGRWCDCADRGRTLPGPACPEAGNGTRETVLTGRIVSHYELQSLLGEGAMGRVYRAHDVILERHVALKLVSATSPTDPAFMDRFLREARLAAQLNHPHIATIYEFGSDQGEAFL